MRDVTMDAPRLTPEQRRELEGELRAERARLERSIAPDAARGDAAPPETRFGILAMRSDDDHPALAIALHGRAASRYAAVLAALDRLVDGSYGECLSCQRPIPYGRLIAMPEAAHCIDCGAHAGMSPC